MSAASLINKYGVMVSVTRAGTGGSYVQGKWVQAPAEVVEVKASVQPVNGKDMKMLPQGAMPEEWLKLYTLEPLKQKTKDAQADRITYNGVQYDVSLVKTYEIPGTSLNHSMNLCGRVSND